MAEIGIAEGDMIRITSDYGSIFAIAEADDTMRPGVVPLAHGWGGDPVECANDWDKAANVNLLIDSGQDYATVCALPRMSSIPVNVVPV